MVVLHQNGQDTAHYVDSFGYKEVPEFFKEQENALIPADLETGETIKTPRGTFYVTAMSREQMEAAGYGLHHQSDDGKYLIMGNGTRAFAVPVQPENYLKAAEQTTEQNYNMIDGQINNTPTTAELEAKVKAGETISLVDLAEAVKADKGTRQGSKTEKKPSIRAQLRADKEKPHRKKRQNQKSRIGGMSMIRLTVEETNLLSIYNEGGKRGLMENINAALPFMDEDMRELAKRTPCENCTSDRK